MPRKKHIKVSGSSIVDFSVQVKQMKSEDSDILIDIVDLEISTNDDVYRYDIRKDNRAPDIYKTRDYIEDCLKKAQRDLLKVRISEYKERMYLFFNVQNIGEAQYSGWRV